MTADTPAPLSRAIVDIVETALGASVRGVESVPGGTQVAVWRATVREERTFDVAVRLVGRDIDLVRRQQAVIEQVRRRGAPVVPILAVEAHEGPGDPACIQVMSWAGGRHPRAFESMDSHRVGQSLGELHLAFRGYERCFPDRPLRLDTYSGYLGRLMAAGEAGRAVRAPVERHQKALRAWDEYYGIQLPRQLIHGDAHRSNVVIDHAGARFIDFDKLMVGPRVFDIAKYVSTSCFLTRSKPRLSRQSIDALLHGYTRANPLTDAELASLFPLCLILNTESALWGLHTGRGDVLHSAREIGRWWEGRAYGTRLSRLRRTSPVVRQHQLPLFRTSHG